MLLVQIIFTEQINITSVIYNQKKGFFATFCLSYKHFVNQIFSMLQ